MGLAEGLFNLIECLYFWIRQMFCKHEYQSGWKDLVTGEPKKVCYKCNKVVLIQGGFPIPDEPILTEEDIKDLDLNN